MKAMEPKTLVSHQLPSLVSQDPRSGGKTASTLKTTDSNETQPGGFTRLSYSHKASRSLAQEFLTRLALTAATLNTLVLETGKKEEREKEHYKEKPF